MNILILGAGEVGRTLAEHLAREAFDITLVDNDATKLRELRDRLDIRTIQGHASQPDVLRDAGAENADMLIAVTPNDEVNMVACQVCYSMFRTPTKIARIRSDSYHNRTGFFSQDHMPIDVLINPERVVTDQIKELLHHPGAIQVLDFAEGRVKLVAMRAHDGGPLIGQELRFLRQHSPNVDTRVAAIFRRGRAIIPEGNTIIEAGDDVFFIAAAEHIEAVMAELGRVERPYKRVIIAGGGLVGELLAKTIQTNFSAKVFEFSEPRAKELAQRLGSAIVICGDATDEELLLEENIERTDAFCAVTNDDKVNILSSLLSKRLGARHVVTLIGNPAYLDLMEGGDIDVAISPQLATASTILRHVRRADVARVHSLRRGAAEAMETIVHGDPATSKVVGKRVCDLGLPAGTTIGAIVRGENVLIAHDEVVVESDDHVILFLADKRRIAAVEQLFQVGLSFF
jgi:trk system potassium uptake protein TrkA